MEALLGDSADEHAKEIEAAHAKIVDLRFALESCANQDHHMSLEMRLGYMEALLGDSADKHAKKIKALEGKMIFTLLSILC